ncbi:ABC transporter permease [Acidobacteriia bacterium AH_259_A11_L15]|nr:ABC transporter permease [Acidobacteriia bacterium AH_259_A11_L15]
MGRLIWANLRARPLRTLLSITAVSLQVFLLLFLMGLTDGIVTEWGERVEGIGADLLVQPPNASLFLAFSSAVLPEGLTSRLEGVEGVESVSPALAVVNTNSLTMIYGIDYQSFNRMGRGFLFHHGRPFQGPHEVIIDDIKAASKDLKVGDTVQLLNQNFRVVGIVEHGRGARYFIPLTTAQELLGVENRVSMFWVKSSGDPGAVRQQFRRFLPRHRIRLMDEYLSLMVSTNLPAVRPFTNAVILVGLVITFLVILLSMYTIVLERTREIGILKALGASRSSIVGLVLRESLLIAAFGCLVGVLASFGVKEIVMGLRPTMNILITPQWLVQGILLAVGGCLLGSFYPALRAASADPVAALAYE